VNRQRWLVWLRVAFVVVTTPLLFVLLEAPARHLELVTDVGAMRLVGITGVPFLSGTSAMLRPSHHQAFWVYLAPSCSSLASILTLGCLAMALPRRVVGGRSRLAAFIAAAAAVFLGNLLRIDMSIGAGLIAGRVVLVLFHNWAGSIFGFAYTLGGFILMLWMLLPGRREGATSRAPAALPAVPGAPARPAEASSGLAGAAGYPVSP
jgi:exosortase/archaeosortase family protein